MSGSAALDPATTLGPVSLVAGDVDRLTAFYETAIGLRVIAREGDVVTLGAGALALVELVGDPAAPPRPPRTTGLFHLALLVPTRADLARAIHRVTQAGWSFTGASDHLVSEALYLDDPEGNGIEIYRDRPRAEWRYDGGALRMGTAALDLHGVLAALAAPDPGERVAPGTTVGHVHLQVADLAAAEAFYCGALGFDVTVRGYPGALFVSAGGYHHHLGLNTWAGAGAPAPPPGCRGLRRFTILLPEDGALAAAVERLRAAGLEPVADASEVTVADPSGNVVRLATRAA